MKVVPTALIYLRLVLGFLILALKIAGVPHYPVAAVVLFSIGLGSDIADGMIARHLEISTPGFRRLDSAVDQVFFSLVTLATFLECPAFFREHRIQLAILILAEGLTYLVCFLKFRKEIATHAIASKVWAIILFATLVEIMVSCSSEVLFEICFYTGVLTRIEVIGIVLLLPAWTHDVPSIFHAWQLRKGRPVQRHKMFNG